MAKIFIENRDMLRLLSRAFTLSRMSDKGIKDELSLKLKQVRSYTKDYRNNIPDQSGWDCGRQDAFGDKIDQLYFEYNALKLAYKISKSDATLLNHYFKIMIGDNA